MVNNFRLYTKVSEFLLLNESHRVDDPNVWSIPRPYARVQQASSLAHPLTASRGMTHANSWTVRNVRHAFPSSSPLRLHRCLHIPVTHLPQPGPPLILIFLSFCSYFRSKYLFPPVSHFWHPYYLSMSLNLLYFKHPLILFFPSFFSFLFSYFLFVFLSSFGLNHTILNLTIYPIPCFPRSPTL